MMLARVWLILCLSAAVACAQYDEPYRPQYHFTPRTGWIGDPDGLIRHRGVFHLYWWGHATSRDLVYWDQQPHPMKGDDGSFHYFTGSVVVDRQNTSGLGTAEKPPTVAVYTAHDKKTGLETQCISSGTDDGATFTFYAGNPVLDIDSTQFRDPDVFWHEPSKRWVMAITCPEDRTVRFYGSPDLKAWTHLSTFGPLGARSQLWEVPNLFQMPFNGQMKWVLTCGMGPNRVQYFVGSFDGTAFTPDRATTAFLNNGTGLEGNLLGDFENGYAGWARTGDAFAVTPGAGGLGKGCANSKREESATGTLVSDAFVIRNRFINFLIAGNDTGGTTAFELIVDGKVVRTAIGTDGPLCWRGWDVAQWKDRSARLRVRDDSPAVENWIAVDHILQSDVLRNTGNEHALWLDDGPDFYAARTFRDYDNDGALPIICMAWMGNWQYARDVPTRWGKGAQSLPRVLSLERANGNGARLAQRPLPALQKLRGQESRLGPTRIDGVAPLTAFRPTRNVYEIQAEFDLDRSDTHVGLNLCTGPGQKIVVGYDRHTANIYVDRTQAGNVAFNPDFARRVDVPFPQSGNTIRFHVFVDQSSIEVFVNDGGAGITSLVFPDARHTGIELFSVGGPARLRSLTAWPLRSIWQ